MLCQKERNRLAGVPAAWLVYGLLAMTLPLGACVSNTVLVKQESKFSKMDPLVVVAESEDRLGIKGRLEHLLLAQGFNVVSDVGDHKRLVVTEERPTPPAAAAVSNEVVGTVKRMTTDIQNRYPVNYAFRFGYQTDSQGDVVKLTGSIVDLRSGEFVFSYEFQDGLVTPFSPYFLGEELAKHFHDDKPVRAGEGTGTLRSSVHDNSSSIDPSVPSLSSVGQNAAAKNSQANANKVELVKEIAWQTNLLALNTSVEAARHAMPGHPMMTVATEIKNLADRSMLGVLELGTLMHTPVAAEYRAEELLAQLTPELEAATQRLVMAQGGKELNLERGVVTLPAMPAAYKEKSAGDAKTTGRVARGADGVGMPTGAAGAEHPVPTPAPRLRSAGMTPTHLAMAVVPVPTPKPRAVAH
ncbi:MAG: hypothetical protein HQL66_10310 [Magnetococcales bacterium]|nr:hypothetical protein [Magnetococcales bacterium]